MFVIDDGSTDNTKEIIEGYFDKFKKKDYSFHYIYQDNQGQATAINNGLKLIQGEYLVWPDADDWYAESDALESMAAALDNTGEDVSCCRCIGSFLNEDSLSIDSKVYYGDNIYQNLFENCLFASKHFYFPPILYMIKTNVLFNELDERNIYTEKEAGQNWQVLLPILYRHKCITVENQLALILKNSNSHSRKKLGYEKEMKKRQVYKNTCIATISKIKNMPELEKEDFICRLKNHFSIKSFTISFSWGEMYNAKEIYRKMIKEKVIIPKNIKRQYLFCFIPSGFVIYTILKKTWHLIRLRK
jgi:glycosyltransferase involved in cell wall biosynthesis